MATPLSRRQFLQTSTVASGALSPFLASSARAAASGRVRVGFIGCGGRGRQLMRIMRHFADVDIVAVSDVIAPRMERAAEQLDRPPRPQKPALTADYRRMLDRRDIDAVVIATTQHWHGLPHIHAAQAGKAIFVEKPLSHTVTEGRAMVEASRRHGVLSMMGTQQRAGGHYQKAVEMIRGGRLGTVALVECWNYHDTGTRTGRRPDSEPPPGVDWDRWLGPAPWVPFNPGRLDSSWWFDYGGGMLTNWAVHHIDVILWAMQQWHPGSVDCFGSKYVVDDLADTPDTIEASWAFDGWQMQYRYRGFNNAHVLPHRPRHHGIRFHGTQASLVLDRHGYELWEEDQPGRIAEEVSAQPYFSEKDPGRSEQDGPWQRTFIDCLKEGTAPPVSLEESHRATVCCHLANIAYLTGRRIRWNGRVEEIEDDAEAAGRLSRPRRDGYELPS